MIEVATNLRDELLELQSTARRLAADMHAPIGACIQRVELNGNKVACTAGWRKGRNGVRRQLVATWTLNGKRLGFNALVGALRREGVL